MALPEGNNLFFTLFGLILLLSDILISRNLLRRWKLHTVGLHYPPGPKPKLFFGNVNDFPAVAPWLTYTADWAEKYGKPH